MRDESCMKSNKNRNAELKRKTRMHALIETRNTAEVAEEAHEPTDWVHERTTKNSKKSILITPMKTTPACYSRVAEHVRSSRRGKGVRCAANYGYMPSCR